MSEFQYYEFQAIDRQLTKEEINKISGLSSRSRVNKNRAIFTYNFGSFRGKTDELLANHFDAFLYTSNFGTKELSFRIPTSLFNAKALCLYEYEYAVEVEAYGDNTLITLHFNDDEGGGWVDEEDCSNLLDDMKPIRESLIKGDPRALYLTLLAHKDRIKSDDEGDEERGDHLQSLPIPPNLKNLDSALETLITFFEIPKEVLQEAAQRSPDIVDSSPDPVKMLTLLSEIPPQEKDVLLLRVLQGDAHVAIELNNKIQERMVERGGTKTAFLNKIRINTMVQNAKMSIKTFTEEYTSILENKSAEELRAILMKMANNVDQNSRGDFIKSLSPAKEKPPQIDLALSENDILDEIVSLIEDIEEQGSEEPDWGEYDDEDSLGEYEQFVDPMEDLFSKTNALFDAGYYKIARTAYEGLFSIFEIEDGYGRGIRSCDLEATALEEIRSRYFRSIYMTEERDNRVACLLEAMEKMSDSDFGERPKLKDIIEISTSPLPEFQSFLEQAIQVTKTDSKPSYDAWFRETTFLLHGLSGLQALAKNEGYKRPRVFVDWIQALMDEKNFSEALNVVAMALKEVPKSNPIRAHIGDLMIECGQNLKDQKIQYDGLWLSFESKPNLMKLLELYHQREGLERQALMKQTAEVINSHIKSPSQYRDRGWERDQIEQSSRPTQPLLLQAHLLSHEENNAFQLSRLGSSLGWSSGENPQPLFVAYCLARATREPFENLPPYIKALWDDSLNNASKTRWDRETSPDSLMDKLRAIYREIFSNSEEIDSTMIAWCMTASVKRIRDIVGNQHRGAYDRAALLTGACVEALKTTSKQNALEFFNKVKNEFPRHSAFQSELKQLKLSWLV